MATRVSEHFTLEELTKSNTAKRLGLDNTPPADVVTNLTRLATELEKVRSITNKSLVVHCAYRSKPVNHAVGGSEPPKKGWSYHIFGLAADFDPPAGWTHDQLQHAIAARTDIEFDLVLEEKAKDGSQWLHFQIAKPGEKPRRLVRDAELDRQGGTITRIAAG